MLKIAYNEIIVKWKKTVILAIFLGIIFTLGISSITTYDKVIEKYKPFKNLFKKNGYEYLITPYGKGYSFEKITEDIIKGEKVESAICWNGNFFSYAIISEDNERKDYEYELFAYGKVMGEYSPEISKGVWYTDAKKVEGQVEVVVTPNEYGIGLGDTFYISSKDKLKAHVCGVTEPNISYFEVNGGYRDSSIFDYYEYYSAKGADRMLIFASQEDVKKETEGKIKNYVYGSLVFVSMKNIEDRTKLVEGNDTFIEFDDFETLNNNSKKEIRRRLDTIIPVFLAIIVLSLISIVCITAVDTNLSLNDYAVYYIEGMKWSGIVIINLLKTLLQSVIGIGLMFVIKQIVAKIMGKTFLFEFGMLQIVCCMLIVTVVSLISCIIPMIITKTKSPVDVLRTSRMM